IDIAHRDWRTDRRTEPAARHRAYAGPRSIDDRGALARRRPPVRTDANPLACGPLGQLPQDHRGAGKAALGAPPFADCPGEPGLDRRRRLVDVVTAKTQPGFEAQRVARAEPDRHDLRLAQQPLGDSGGLLGRYRDLEPVLA